MKRLFVTIVCLQIVASLHAQGITLLYKNGLGWNDPRSWIQINTPVGQTPIQRVPTKNDDVVISQSLSGISSVALQADSVNAEFNIGDSTSPGVTLCRSMHVSNTDINFYPKNSEDIGAFVNVYTSHGGFVILDSGSNVNLGIFQLHGGNPAIVDLQIINSTFGVLTDFTDYADIYMDSSSKARIISSSFGGMSFGGGSLYAENSTINTDGFTLADKSSDTILNSTIEAVGLSGVLHFLIGRNSNFVSSNVTVKANSDLNFGTSGSMLNGNVSTLSDGGGNFSFLQEDPANPLPNIINGNLTVSENEALGFNGDVKISGNLIFFTIDELHDGPSNVAPVIINGQDAFDVGGVYNFEGSLSVTGCANNYCHYKLEFFGNTNSNISWPGGFPVDTLIINKTGCAKVTIDSSLYVSGATRIESGQLVLNPNDDHPYKFVCAGNVDIAQGGGLFLRRDSNGVVANMAFGGTLVDHNSIKDSACAGLSNPYGGIITSTHDMGITLLYNKDMGWNNPLSWIQINTPSGQTPIQRVPIENDDVVISSSMSGISSVSFVTDSTNSDFNVGGSSPNGPSRCRSMHVSNTKISIDNPSIVDGAPSVNVYTANGGFVIIDSGSNMLHGHFQLHGGSQAITDLEILNSTYGVLFSHADWTGIEWDADARIRLVGSNLGGYNFYGDSSVNIFIDSCTIQTTNFHLGDNSTAILSNSTVTNNGDNPIMTFFIGKNSVFSSTNDTVRSFADLSFTTSGLQLNGNVYAGYSVPDVLDFLQEDPANPLPNIINGNLSAGELNNTMGISGDLKISGNISGFSDYAVGSPTPVLVDGAEVFGMGGITNYGGTTSINNCMNDFCHFKLELFGNTNSRITWNTGFPVDTLIINKTNCAKVTIDSSLYVSGATRIASGQLVLNPNDNHPYKFVCAGNVNIAQGGGLFLRRDAKGVVAKMAVEGTLVDDNATADSTCAGFSNPYNGTADTTVAPDSLFNFIGSYQNKTVNLRWSTLGKINTRYFTIEKSFDQVTFLPLGNITASGNPTESDYQFTDQSSLKAINYYRLKIINADSSFTYGKIIAVAAPVINKIVIFPNPVTDKLLISLADASAETDIVIADARGVVVKKLQLMTGTMETSVNITDVQPGVYSISFQSGHAKSTQQFVKL